MTDINPTPTEQPQASGEMENTERTVPKARFNEVNEELKTIKQQLAEIEKQRRDSEVATLAEQNRWKELYEATQKELEPLKGISEEAKRYRDRLEADNLARIERIPEDKRSLIPEYDDPVKLGAWLTANEVTLTGTVKPIAPNLGGGAGGNVKQPDYKLSQFELDMAKAAGMSPERYAQQKAKKGQALDLDELKKQKNKEI
jgi:hypothetical protein